MAKKTHRTVIQRAAGVSRVPSDDEFRCWAEAALATTGNCEVSIRIVGEAEGQELNHRFRRQGHATNVLSFPADIPEQVSAGLELQGLAIPLGDLVICAPVVRREAREQGKPEGAHWAHLTVHGILHLLGYDHRQKAQAREMERLEVRILGGLGLPDPYRDAADTTG